MKKYITIGEPLWLIVESDWESAVVLEAWSTEEKAEARAKELEAERRNVGLPKSSVWGIGVEDVPFKG